jgi:hypothetical protein
MALDTYDKLVQFVVSTIGRRSIEDQAQDWIWIAELEAQRELDLESVERFTDGTLDADLAYLELPPDYVELRQLTLLTDPARQIRIAPPTDAVSARAATNANQNPGVGYVSNGRLYFQRPGLNEDYELLYMAGIEHLGSNNQTSWLLRVGADYLAYTALAHSAMYSGDQRIELWAQAQRRAEASMRRQAFSARAGGGPLYMRSDWGQP